MKDNQEQNGIQKRLTEKEALKFLAGRKPRAKRKPAAPVRNAAAKKNRKIREHSENVMKPDDVLIANIGGKSVALNEAKRKEIIEFVLALGEEAEGKEKKKEAKEAFTACTLKTQRKNTGITIIFVHGRCSHKKAAQL